MSNAVTAEIESIELEYTAHTLKAWCIVLAAALFFFYEFLQMNMFDAITPVLMQSFGWNATELSKSSAYYFIANVLFLLPAGVLLDRYSTKKIILVALGICVLGTALFSLSTQSWQVIACRFFTGIGSAFCFLSCIRLASRWFPENHMALVTGVVVTMAMTGGMLAQTPLLLLVKYIHWRDALLYDALGGVVIWFVILAIVQDYPPSVKAEYDHEIDIVHQLGFFETVKRAFGCAHNWLGGLYTCLMNLPLGVLGALWGASYLTHVQSVGHECALMIVSMLFVGTIVGAPVMGWLSDRWGKRRPMMMIGSVASLLLVSLIIFLHTSSTASLFILFLLLGFFTSTQIIGYPLVAEGNAMAITAMAVSVVNISVQSGDGIFQLLFGYLMDLHQHLRGATKVGYHHYLAVDYRWALWILPVGFVFAFLAVYASSETYCQHLEERDGA